MTYVYLAFFQNRITVFLFNMYELKKSLGQHFLKDEDICKKIVAEVESLYGTQLLEIGPGGGAITKYLYTLPNIDFKAVELDIEKVDFLKKTYPMLQDKIIHKSILDMEVPFNNDFNVVGNFPYNISSQIVFKLLEWKGQVTAIVGMFQKEVALRLAASEGSKVYGITSVLTQAFFNVTYLFDVPPQSFTPPPKVMSGVIKFERRTDVPEMTSVKDFFVVVKTGFSQRRKTLRNALKPLFNETVLKEELFNKRAEQLTVQDFAALTFKLKKING